MAFQDPASLREKIINFLKTNGPSLPVHISRETGLSILFSSAFLSELLAEKEVKMSDLRVGSSPVYFLPGQEPFLEKFAQHLKSKEKEAFLILKEKKFLKDSELSPAIRVAMRGIKDFALPIQGSEGVVWKYFTAKDEEFKEEPKIEIKIEEEPKETEIGEDGEEEIEEDEEEVEEGEEQEETDDEEMEEEDSEPIEVEDKDALQKKETKKPKRKKISKKKNDKFFDKVKEFISKQSLDILDIESFDANQLALKVKDEEKEFLIIAFNKKRLTENDVLGAYKKAYEKGLKYWILLFGEPVKKLENLINASRELERIEKIG
ncbi:MAG TPA: hypothetical protein VMC80_01990 [Patescibacteria group bacterium]|nr:hypothetical protein [Patescibacteria group bacterium]